MDPPATGASVSGRIFQHIPYNQRWNYLQEIIVDAFLGRNPPRPPLKFKELSEFMARDHAFNAQPEDYRYRLRKWGIRKNIKKGEKEAIVTALGKRNRPEDSVSSVEIQQGDSMKPVDIKQLKRYLKDSIRHYTTSPLTPGMFSKWNLPYTAYRASLKRQADHPSPFILGPMTPEYLNVNSPEAGSAGQEFGMTPTFAMVQQRTLLDRSNLLLQGRREDLLGLCNAGDRRIISDWLHDYWMYCFMTAKFWGFGPQEWTSGLISQFRQSSTTFGTPQSFHSPLVSSPSSPASLSQDCSASESIRPKELCFYAVHLKNEEFDELSESEDEPSDEKSESEDKKVRASFEIHDASSWTPWPASEKQTRSHQACMQDAFNDNRFSAIAPETLAVSHDSIAVAISKSPKVLKVDSWAFAIMAGNRELIEKLENEMWEEIDGSEGMQDDFDEIQPYHLAASYLDGGRDCCHIMCDLTRALAYYHPIALNNLDSNGHTVLDSLIISILRSHTNITPAEVSTSFLQCFRFPGEEKDICGRWDADSPEVRHLHQAGKHRVPETWKHNFCHSSVQAVCHCAMAIFMTPSRPNINTLSGLFRRRCRGVHCRLEGEVKLGPLHALVAVAFCLAENGKDGETMFGAVALLVCMLVLGADTTLLADISVRDLFSSAEQDECSHRSITAMELADQVPKDVIDGWKPSCRLGWKCLSLILRRVTRVPQNQHFSTNFSNVTLAEKDYEDWHAGRDCFIGGDHYFFMMPCSGESLGLLWAAIQTELVTYRKVTVGEPEVSSNFDFAALLRWLEEETLTFETPLVIDGWMESHTSCGWFRKSNSSVHNRDIGFTVTDVSSKNPTYYVDDVLTRVRFVKEPCHAEGFI